MNTPVYFEKVFGGFRTIHPHIILISVSHLAGRAIKKKRGGAHPPLRCNLAFHLIKFVLFDEIVQDSRQIRASDLLQIIVNTCGRFFDLDDAI